jgi:hypothetical protein
MQQTSIFRWQDRSERSFAVLHLRGGHFRVSWGTYDPPQSDNLVEQGAHTTSAPDEAVQLMLEHIRALADEPDEAVRIEPRLRDALHELV